MKLILVRHAQTHLNTQRRYQGKRTDNELNEYGIRQAKKTREYLKNRQFDAIFSSPQKRAIQTAMIINKHHNKKIIIDENLVERDFGVFDGRKYENVDYLKVHHENLYKEYEIETEEELEERIMNFFNCIHKNYLNKTILIVSHGGTIKMLLSKLQNIPWVDALYNLKKDNASVSVIEFDENKKIKKIDINRNKHLL